MTQSSSEQPQARLTDSEDAVVVNHSVDTVVQPSSNESEEQAQPQEVVSSVTPSLPSQPSAELSSNTDQQATPTPPHNTQASNTSDEAQSISSNRFYLQGYSEGFKQANQQWLNTHLLTLTQEVNQVKASNVELKRELELMRKSLSQLQQNHPQPTTSSNTILNVFQKVGTNTPSQAEAAQTSLTQKKPTPIRKSATPTQAQKEAAEFEVKKAAADLNRLNQERQFMGLPPLTQLPDDYYQRGRSKKAAKLSSSSSAAKQKTNSSVIFPSNSAAWIATAKYLRLEDYKELQNVELTEEDLRDFPAVYEELKSPIVATVLHFFFGTFGAGYYYIQEKRWSYHLVITICLMSMFAFSDRARSFLSLDYYDIIDRNPALAFVTALWQIYLIVKLFTISKETRNVNSQKIREWLIARGYPVNSKNQ